ncbi:MAG TPA: hypothetical protein VED17_03690 [Nitrososphaerales archaeon]|nr:hypothetical protein [Nitrososphaerales archaeon]
MIFSDLIWAGLAGLVSGIAMTLLEFPFWKKWGMEGVSEWQVNWVMMTCFNSKWRLRQQPILSWTIASHIFHGVLIGIALRLVLPVTILLLPVAKISTILDAVVLAVALWFFITFSGRKRFEVPGKIRITNRGLLVGLLSGIIFGIVLGLLLSLFPDSYASLP